MNEERVAIVCSGGGMRCAYSAGALLALVEKYHLTTPAILIPISGSAGSAMYYLAGQYDSLKRAWTQLLSTPRFISLFRFWEIMNVDYLIDEVLKKQEPLQVATLLTTQTRYFIPVTDSRTRQVHYVTNDENADVFEVLRAAKAIPYFFGRKVFLEGHTDIDGAWSVTFEDAIEKAVKEGATLIIAIGTRHSYKKSPLLRDVTNSNIILVTNARNPASALTRNAKKLEASFDMGYRDVSENVRLKETFG